MTSKPVDSSHGAPCVLIMEDDSLVLRSIMRLLSDAGYRALGAHDGREGLRLLEQEAVDVVITDLVMPDVDGIEIIRALRRTRPDVPVIAISGGGVMPKSLLLESARAMGAVAAIPKPFTRADLLDGLERAMAGRERSS